MTEGGRCDGGSGEGKTGRRKWGRRGWGFGGGVAIIKRGMLVWSGNTKWCQG